MIEDIMMNSEVDWRIEDENFMNNKNDDIAK
jgi:hypothetical protein